jgi:hypothetical protein
MINSFIIAPTFMAEGNAAPSQRGMHLSTTMLPAEAWDVMEALNPAPPQPLRGKTRLFEI